MCHGRLVLLLTGSMSWKYLLVAGVSKRYHQQTYISYYFSVGINCTVEDLDLITNSQDNVELTNYKGATYYEIELK